MNYNILEEYINFSRTCLKNYTKKILGNKYNQDILDSFLKVYIDARYYNASKIVSDNFEINIGYALRENYEHLKKQKIDHFVAEKTFKVFKYLFYFDNVKESPSMKGLVLEIEKFRIDELGLKKDKRFNQDIFEMVKSDLIQKKNFIDKFRSKDFVINLHLTNIDKIYNNKLESSLKFPDIYDKKSIEKVFDAKDLFEEKLFIEYCYVTSLVLLDIIRGEFDKGYLVNYSSDLNKKPSSFKKLFSVIDNDATKEKITIKINYSDFIKDRENFYAKMRLGFRFAVIIDEGFRPVGDYMQFLDIFKYIIVSSKSIYYVEFKEKNNLIVLR